MEKSANEETATLSQPTIPQKLAVRKNTAIVSEPVPESVGNLKKLFR